MRRFRLAGAPVLLVAGNSIRGYALSAGLPAGPEAAASPTCLGGTVGISILGLLFYSAFDALGRDAGAHEVQDACGGHPQTTGRYHFHGLSPCWQDSALSRKTHLVGWALDFPSLVSRHRGAPTSSATGLDIGGGSGALGAPPPGGGP
jgi:YHYH protein